MLQDQIPIDRDGHANRQLIAAIQEQLRTDCDGRLPFLLLPVRIETRFMQVDRPVADDSSNAFLSMAPKPVLASKRYTTDSRSEPKSSVA